MSRVSGSGASEERDPAGADRVNSLERRARLLLRAYPAAYRRERGDEIIGTLLESNNGGRAWPRLCDARALIAGGVKARAAQNRQRSASTNLRVAVMVGITLYFSLWVSTYLVSIIVFSASPNWTATLSGLLIVATVVLAWTGSRAGALAAALAGSVVIVAFGFEGTPFVGPRVVAVLGLGVLAVLGRREARPSWRWLWLPGSVIATSVLVESVGTLFLLSYALSPFTLTGLEVTAVGALVWMAIDARLMVVVLTFLAAIGLQVTVGGVPVAFSLGFILIMTAIATPAIWLLRRQSARPLRTA